MIQIKSEKATFGISVPQTLQEFTPGILAEITRAISVPKHYCIVASCLETTLFTVASSLQSESINMVAITPMVAKIGDEDSERMSTSAGLQAVIHPTDLERGSHLDLPTMISFKKFRKYLREDKNLINKIIKGQFTKEDSDEVIPSNTSIILVEFKIIPVAEIRSSIILNVEPKDPFVYEPVDNSQNDTKVTEPIKEVNY